VRVLRSVVRVDRKRKTYPRRLPVPADPIRGERPALPAPPRDLRQLVGDPEGRRL